MSTSEPVARTTDERAVRRIAAEIAIELREHPDRWFQGALVKFSNGATTSTGFGLTRDDAVCWCLEGLISKRVDNEVRWQAINKFYEVSDVHESLSYWNDRIGRTVEEVIELCEKVAAS